jgi:hypothetical protein
MRVVSLVPSWTETLIEAGIEVVGRTRFCIHPREKVKDIPRVGGTKDWDLERIVSLKPDLVILDREENPKFMSEQVRVPWLATHAGSIADVARDLQTMSEKLSAPALQVLAERWLRVEAAPALQADPERIPGLLEWGRKPQSGIERMIYVIWKDPWMAVGRDTFIYSVFEKLGWASKIPQEFAKYPQVDFQRFATSTTLLLFSSEPYPFLKKREELASLGFPYAWVDGESFSWFGVRTLRFLEAQLGLKPLANP